MGDPVKPTAIQRGVLQDVAEHHIEFSRYKLRFWNHRTKHYMRRPTMEALFDMGACQVTGTLCELTDSGRRALEGERP